MERDEILKKVAPCSLMCHTCSAYCDGVLRMYSDGPCSGCRSTEHNGCSIEGCFLLECTKNHGIDYCGECDEFPCKKTTELFEEQVYKQWLEGNQQIREHGIEFFWESNSGKPHYKSYKE